MTSNLKISQDTGKGLTKGQAIVGKVKNGVKSLARRMNDILVDGFNNPIASEANDKAAKKFKEEQLKGK